MSWMQLTGWEASTEVLAALVRYLLVGLALAGMVGYGGILAYRIWRPDASNAPGAARQQRRRHRLSYSEAAIQAEFVRGVADIERYLATCARSRRQEP